MKYFTSIKGLLIAVIVLPCAIYFLMSLSTSPTDALPLWPQGAPGALGTTDNDIPSLTPYPLKKRPGTRVAAIIVCPGGGYASLADHESYKVAEWLNQQGVAAFVLKYRLGSSGYRHPSMLQDAARAVRLVRAKAGEWNIDPQRVGILGFSAGGHLASTLLTHFDAGKPDDPDPIERQSSRPDLGILCYPVISMTEPNVHSGTRQQLLGENPDPALVKLLSNELHVTADTPPCFIWHTWEDASVKVENSMEFAAALRKAGVPFDLHVYQKGGHGMGLGNGHPWTTDCIFWLRAQGFAALDH